MKPHRPALCGTVLGLIVGLLSGCSLLASSDQKPAIYDGPTEPELKAERIWGSADGTRTSVVALSPDGVVLADPTRPAFLLDAKGEERWRLPARFRLTDGGRQVSIDQTYGSVLGGVIVGDYRWDPCDDDPSRCGGRKAIPGVESGLVAFSPENGKQLWSTPLVPGDRTDPAGPMPGPSVVSESAIVTHLQPRQDERRATEIEAIALDPRSGRRLWSRIGLSAEEVVGDRVLGYLLEPRPGHPDDPVRTPVVLDAATGREVWRAPLPGLWTAPAPFNQVAASSSFRQVTPTYSPDRASEPRAIVVILATGESYPHDYSGAAGEGRDGPFFAWAVGEADGRKLYSTEVASGRLRIGSWDQETLGIWAGIGGYLWVRTDVDLVPFTLAVDRSGDRRLEPVPGLPAAISADWLVTSAAGRLAVYRLSH